MSPDLKDALESGNPVVAREAAVITPGLPKAAAMDAVRRQWVACAEAGATPAVVAVFDGTLRVGLSLDDCSTLAGRRDAVRVSPWNLGSAVTNPGFGGTTVASTVAAAALARIRVVSTGGIGGGYPGREGPDVCAAL